MKLIQLIVSCSLFSGSVLKRVSFCFFSHGECPSKETTSLFIRLCEDFVEKNPTELIGKKSIC